MTLQLDANYSMKWRKWCSEITHFTTCFQSFCSVVCHCCSAIFILLKGALMCHWLLKVWHRWGDMIKNISETPCFYEFGTIFDGYNLLLIELG